MLAISVREALRDAVAAFGAGGIVELAVTRDARGGVLGHRKDDSGVVTLCATTPESCR